MPPVISEFDLTGLLLSIFGVLLALSALASRAIERLGVPLVLVFLVLGMLAGSEGVGGISFDDYRFAFRLGTMALILILFDGGLNTPVSTVRKVLAPAGLLATLGVLATAGLVAVFARWLGLSWGAALLLGAVVSSTDAAAVFAVLRGGRLHLPTRVGTTLELESGVNDPMAVILTIVTTSVLLSQSAAADPGLGAAPIGWLQLAVSIPIQLAVGLLVGLGLGYGARSLFARFRLHTVGLYPVLTLALAFLSFGLASLAQGSGFLAVYTTAMVFGNGPLPYRNGLGRIHDALAWLSQVAMFLMLGLLVYPSRLWPVAPQGLAVALFLTLAARPLAVGLCLAPFRFQLREVVYISWVGLRGAVPIILAIYPVLSSVEGATLVFDMVFFIVVVNTIIPGVTIRWLTRRLGLEEAAEPAPLAALEINSTRLLDGEVTPFYVHEALAVCGAKLADIPFPADASAILIVRGERLMAARGPSVLEPGDHVYIFCRRQDRPFIELLFGRPQDEPAA